MRISKAIMFFILLAAFLALLPAEPVRAGSVALVAADVTQPFMNPEDNFETVLSGNFSGVLSEFLNAFPAPSLVGVSYDSVANETTISFSGQAITLHPNIFETFGFALAVAAGAVGVNPQIVDEYWTSGGTIEGHVPEDNMSSMFSPTTHVMTITISNDPDTFKLSQVGYLVTNTPFSLLSLNRAALPPSAFLSSGVPDGTQLTPGESVSFNIPSVLPGQYVTVFADARFSGSSSSNPYTGVSGRWFEFQAAVPEPSSWVLLAIGSATFLVPVATKSRARRGDSRAAN